MQSRIQGVIVRDLRLIPDDRGYLMEMMRSDWPEFGAFGQAYITACYPGVIKAWHFHKMQRDAFVCVSGMAKVALYDPRENSPTRGGLNVFHLGELNRQLLIIPRGVYHGFASDGGTTALIVNFPDQLYNYAEPDEYRLPYNDPSIPFSWEVKNG